MKTIDRLLQKLKARSELPALAGIQPYDGGWSCTYHRAIRKAKRGSNVFGKCEAVSAWYQSKGAAMVWGKQHIPKNGKVFHVVFVNMQHKDVSEKLGRARGKGYKVKGGVKVYARYETEKAVYQVTRPGRKL